MTSDEEEIRALREIAKTAKNKGEIEKVLFDRAAAQYGTHRVRHFDQRWLVFFIFIAVCIGVAIMVTSYS